MQKLKNKIKALYNVTATDQGKNVKFHVEDLNNNEFKSLNFLSIEFGKEVFIKRSGTGLTIILS